MRAKDAGETGPRLPLRRFSYHPARGEKGPAFDLPTSHPYPTELASLLVGDKPVIFINGTSENAGYIGGIKSRFKLEVLRCGRFPEGLPRLTYFMIGRRRADVLRAEAAWLDDVMGKEWGLMLGYPACCVDAYINSGGEDVVRRALQATRSFPARAWMLNNLFNHFSRLRSKIDHQNSKKFSERNMARGVAIDRTHIAFWHPCAYDCPVSLERAGRIFDHLKRRVPGYVDMVRPLLERTYLYWDNFRMVGLDCVPRGKALLVRGAAELPLSLAAPEAVKALSLGGLLRETSAGPTLETNSGSRLFTGAVLAGF